MSVRVLQIIPTLDRSGAEKQLVMLATGLPRDKFDVHVCALTRGGPLASDLERAGIPLTIIGKRGKIDPFAYFRLKRLIESLRPDIVHTWIFAANAYGRQAAHAAGVRHIVGGERCVDPWKRWHELWIDRRLARVSERIATNSSGVVDFYASKGIPPDKFVVIPNGIAMPSESEQTPGPHETLDGAAAESRTAARTTLLNELGLPVESRLIGCVARLWPQKRFEDLIWATELLKCVHDDVHLLIIGDGPQRWWLERYTSKVQINDRVHFLGERSDVARILPHLHCFWLGSGYEGQSNSLMEAMAAAVPVVATDIAGNRDLVIPGETGFLVPVGDRAEFARKTQRMFEEPALAARLGAAGRERMRRDFSVEKMIERHAALYSQLAGG